MLSAIYSTMLYLCTWTYSLDITTLQALDDQVKNLLSNRFAQFYHNPLADQFQVDKTFCSLQHIISKLLFSL
jgi:hypothetical protein